MMHPLYVLNETVRRDVVAPRQSTPHTTTWKNYDVFVKIGCRASSCEPSNSMSSE